MMDEYATRIIDQVLKAHWPNWTCDGEETLLWVRELRKYDCGLAKTAINNFYMARTKQGKPAPAQRKDKKRAFKTRFKQVNGKKVDFPAKNGVKQHTKPPSGL
jgi:hypothetical protein